VSIVIVCPNRDMSEWVAALHSIDPALDVEVWPDIRDHRAVKYVVSWGIIGVGGWIMALLILLVGYFADG
jgi:hypothetical protein